MMTSDRKKPGVAFWASMMVVAVLAYPLSFGPACWIASRRPFSATLPNVYWPLGWSIERAPEGIANAACAFGRCGMGDITIGVPSDATGRLFLLRHDVDKRIEPLPIPDEVIEMRKWYIDGKWQ
jgi:hypothetical protein